MIRLRWTDPQPDNPSAPVDWRIPSLITATLFLNFGFWSLPQPDFVSGFGLILFTAAASLLMVTLFYFGPALSAQARHGSLYDVACDSFGTLPAFALCAGCAFFLILWTAAWALSIVLVGQMGSHRSFLELRFVTGVVVLFLFFTAFPSLRSHAKLASFTNKLAIAILVATLIRARRGIPAAWDAESYLNSAGAWHYLADLSYYAGPLMLLAAGFGRRCRTKKHALMIGLSGLALPIVASVVGSSLVIGAGLALHERLTSIPLNVGAVLTYGDSRHYLWPKMALLALTMFGLIRFGACALAETISGYNLRRPVKLSLFALSIVAIGWLANYAWDFSGTIESAATALAAVAGVLTADALTGLHNRPRHRFDWIGLSALGVAFLAPWPLEFLLGWSPDSLRAPWLLPIYGISFATCLLGRTIEKLTRIAKPHPILYN